MKKGTTGTTKSGFKFSVDESVFDSMELVDDLAEIDSGNSIAISRVCLTVLGEAQRKRLYDHLRGENGRVPIKAVMDEMTEIFHLVQAKN